MTTTEARALARKVIDHVGNDARDEEFICRAAARLAYAVLELADQVDATVDTAPLERR
jgi:hypothetical protein